MGIIKIFFTMIASFRVKFKNVWEPWIFSCSHKNWTLRKSLIVKYRLEIASWQWTTHLEYFPAQIYTTIVSNIKILHIIKSSLYCIVSMFSQLIKCRYGLCLKADDPYILSVQYQYHPSSSSLPKARNCCAIKTNPD